MYQSTLGVSRNSEGTLAEQAEIYAESWEASRKRVEAAAQGIYDSLLNDEAFIDINNGLTHILGTIEQVIDTFGGLGGVINLAVVAFTKLYGGKVADGLRTTAQAIRTITGLEEKRNQTLRDQLRTQLLLMNDGTEARGREIDVLIELANLQQKINDAESKTTQEKRNQLQQEYNLLSIQAQREQTELKTLDTLQDELALMKRPGPSQILGHSTNNKMYTTAKELFKEMDLEKAASYKNENALIAAIAKEVQKATGASNAAAMKNAQAAFNKIFNDAFEGANGSKGIKQYNVELGRSEGLLQHIQALQQKSKTLTDGTEEEQAAYNQQLQTTFNLVEEQLGITVDQDEGLEGLIKALKQVIDNAHAANAEMGGTSGVMRDKLKEAAEKARKVGEEEAQAAIEMANTDLMTQSLVKHLNDLPKLTHDVYENIVKIGSAIGQAAMNISLISNTIAEIDFSDLGADDLISLVTTLGFVLPSLGEAVKEFGNEEVVTAVKTALLNTELSTLGKVGKIAGTVLSRFNAVLAIAGIAIGVAVGLYKRHQQELEKLEEAKREEIKTTLDEIAANEEVIKSYQELLETYQATGEGKDELAQKASEVAEMVGYENIAVANLTGNYEELNKQILEYTRNQNQRKTVTQKAQIEQDKEDLEDALGINKAGTWQIDANSSYDLAKDFKNQAQAFLDSDFGKRVMQTGQDLESGLPIYLLNFDKMSAAEQLQVLNELDDAINEMKASMETGEEESDFLQNLIKLRVAANETREALESDLELLGQSAVENFTVENQEEIANVKSYESYKDIEESLNNQLQELVDQKYLTQEIADNLKEQVLIGDENLQKYRLQDKILEEMQGKSWVKVNDTEQFRKEILDQLDSAELTTYLQVLPESNSAEQFAAQYSQAVLSAQEMVYQTSIDTMQEFINDINENLTISVEQYQKLLADTNFLDFLEANNFASATDFTRSAMNEQIAIVNDYYAYLHEQDYNYLEAQKVSIQQELSDFQEGLNQREQITKGAYNDLEEAARNYWNAVASGDQEQVENTLAAYEQLRGQISEEENIELKIDVASFDETQVVSRFRKIYDKLEDIADREFEIHVSWDDFDTLASQLDSLGDFAKSIQTDAEQIGDSYALTLEEVQKYGRIFPELFAQAETYKDGLLLVNKAIADDFIDKEKSKLNEAVDTQLGILTLQEENLKTQIKNTELEIEAFQAGESLKTMASAMTTEQQMQLAYNLVQYLKDQGAQEQTAVETVLGILNIDRQQYSDAVAGYAETEEQNVTDAANIAASNSMKSLADMDGAVQRSAHNWQELAKTISFAMAGQVYNPQFLTVDTGTTYNRQNFTAKEAETKTIGEGDTESVEDILGKYNEEQRKNKESGSTDENKYLQAVMDILNGTSEAAAQSYVEYLQSHLNTLENQLYNVQAQKLAVQAIVDSPLKNGLTGPDKDKDSGSDNEAELKENLEEALERYHEITREIEIQEKKLDKLGKAIDRAYGKDKLDYFVDEMYEINKAIELQTQKAEAALGFVAIDAGTIESLGLQPQYKSNLEISNYTALLQQAQNEYQAAIDKYNSQVQGATDKQKEKLEDELDAAEKLFENRKDALESYEESVDTYREMLEQIEQYQRDLEDNKLNQITTKFELILDVKEAKDDVRDFAQQIIESFSDEVYHGLDSLANQYQGALENIDFIPNLESTQNKLIGLLNSANEYTDVNAIVDELGNLRGEIISTGEALLDWLDNLENEFPDALADATDRFQVFTGVLEHNQSILDTIKELMTLQGMLVKTERGYTDMQRIAESSMKASLGDARMNKLRYDRASQELLQAEATLRLYQEGDAGYDGAYQKWKALLEETEDAEAAYLESARAAMEKAREIYTNAIEKAAYDFEQILSKNQGFDLLQSKFDNFVDEEERYLDAVNKIYETTKLNDKVQASLDNATDAAQAAKLKALQEEFKQRQANNKLSEYDIEIMEAKYNMILKEMALEEARNNNSQVRLRRNAQGNMSYYYTTDPDAIADAEGDYNDAAQEWYNLAKDRVKETSGEIIEAWQEMNEQIKEIYNDESLTVEEREAQIAEIRRHYSEILQDLESEKQKAIKDMTEAGEIVIDDFENNYADSMNSMSEAVENFDERFDDCINQMNEAFYNYGQTTQEIGGATGTTYDELSQKIDQTTQSTQEFTNAGLEATNEMWNSLSALQDQIDKYLELAAAIAQAIEQLRQLAAMNAQAVESTVSNNVQYKETYDADTDYMAEALKYAAQGKSELAAEALRKRWAKTEDLGIDYNRDADIQRVQGVLGGTAAQKQELYDYLTQGPYDSYGASQRADAMRGNTISNSSLSTISSAIDSMPINLPRVNTSNYNSNVVNNNNNARSNVYNVQANFPNASNTQEIQDAILGLENYASQYVYAR